LAQGVGFIGGTGPEGKGLAVRFARAGLDVFIGSRTAERGREAAAEVTSISGGKAAGGTNDEAAASGDIVVVTTPYSGLNETLSALGEQIGGRIVVSAVVPLQFSRARVGLLEVAGGSAAEEAQRLLPEARVVGAFHNLSASHLLDIDHALEGDVIICGDDKDALDQVIQLTNLMGGVRGVNGGPLANTRYVEALTALLININRVYKAETQVRIVGI
jgi:NADPH-dependent F420 reductase